VNGRDLASRLQIRQIDDRCDDRQCSISATFG
jgi:hypothetical protein